MKEFECLQMYRLLTSYAAAYGNEHTPEHAPDKSPQCFRYGVNEQILFEVGMHSDIKRFVEGMIMTIDRSHFLQQSLGSSWKYFVVKIFRG